MFLVFLFCGVFADLLAPYGMNQISLLNRLKPPSWQFPFGTDNLGRDMLAPHGAQLSVIIGFCAAGLATLVSVALGIVTGYLGGKLDLITQRFVDAWMSFPGPHHPDRRGGGRPGHAADHRHARPAARHRRLAHHPQRGRVGAREHVRHAAQSIGAWTWRILCHILLNVMPPIIVLFTTRVGTVILAESGRFSASACAAGADLGRHAVRHRAHLHVPGLRLALAPGLCLTAVVYATMCS